MLRYFSLMVMPLIPLLLPLTHSDPSRALTKLKSQFLYRLHPCRSVAVSIHLHLLTESKLKMYIWCDISTSKKITHLFSPYSFILQCSFWCPRFTREYTFVTIITQELNCRHKHEYITPKLLMASKVSFFWITAKFQNCTRHLITYYMLSVGHVSRICPMGILNCKQLFGNTVVMLFICLGF